jgi:hypothetical protein
VNAETKKQKSWKLGKSWMPSWVQLCIGADTASSAAHDSPQQKFDLMQQELPPHQRHSKTSTLSALKAAPRFNERSLLILKHLCLHGGMTDQQGQEVFGISGDSYRPMRVRLTQLGMVEDSGDTGTTPSGRKAVIWVATLEGKKLIFGERA